MINYFYMELQDSDAGRDWGQEEKGTTEDCLRQVFHYISLASLELDRDLIASAFQVLGLKDSFCF